MGLAWLKFRRFCAFVGVGQSRLGQGATSKTLYPIQQQNSAFFPGLDLQRRAVGRRNPAEITDADAAIFS